MGVLSEPVVLHVIRPYASAEEYLKHEAWTMDARTMLLIGEADLPPGTPVTFDVTLGDGSRPIRAEARALANVEPSGSRPGGLRVRFKRYGASTKTFIDRAVELSDRASLRPVQRATPEPPRPASVAPAAAPAPEGAPAPAPAREAGTASEEVQRALSLLRGRTPITIDPPEERELLLERLRQRNLGEEATMRHRV